jgi:hypothetical protein
MTDQEILIVDDMLHAKAKAMLHTMYFLNERRGRANCSADERNEINRRYSDLNTQLGLVELQIAALDANTLVVQPPLQDDVTKIRDLVAAVDSLNQSQVIAAATWTFFGSVLDATAPLVKV